MIRNFAWDFAGKAGNQVVSFILSIVLTRLLLPHEYGLMGMAMVIIFIAGLFLDLGFHKALIQQKEVSEAQYSTVFFINMGIAIALITICFFTAGPLADFYDEPQIKPIFRALSLVFFFNALTLVASARLYRAMKFKAITIIAIVSVTISGIVGIAMASNGFGVWSLVGQALTNAFFLFLFNTFYVRFKPRMIFEISTVMPLWRYGSRLFASGFLDVLFTRLDVFLIGKLFSPATLGFYTRAQTVDQTVKQLSSSSITSVLFPHISRHQDDRVYLGDIFKKYLHIVMFLATWMSGVLFLTAENIFTILFTDTWSYAGTLFRIMAAGAFIWPVSNLMCCFIIGVGNSKAFLRLEVYKKLILVPVYAFGFLYGLEIFIVFWVVGFYLALLLNAIFASREVPVKAGTQLMILGNYLLLGLVSVFASAYVGTQLGLKGDVVQMFFFLSVFSVFYFLGSYIFRFRGFQVILAGIKNLKLS